MPCLLSQKVCKIALAEKSTSAKSNPGRNDDNGGKKYDSSTSTATRFHTINGMNNVLNLFRNFRLYTSGVKSVTFKKNT